MYIIKFPDFPAASDSDIKFLERLARHYTRTSSSTNQRQSQLSSANQQQSQCTPVTDNYVDNSFFDDNEVHCTKSII